VADPRALFARRTLPEVGSPKTFDTGRTTSMKRFEPNWQRPYVTCPDASACDRARDLAVATPRFEGDVTISLMSHRESIPYP